MLYSMTGFGNARMESDIGEVYVEIKTLNGKFLDFNIRLDSYFNSKDIILRHDLEKKFKRGRINVLIVFKSKNNINSLEIQKGVFKQYYTELKELAQDLEVKQPNIFEIISSFPCIYQADMEHSSCEKEWTLIMEAVNRASENCNTSRANEGSVLSKIIEDYILSIQKLIRQIEPFERERVQKIKERLKINLQKLDIGFDTNRLEQEFIYHAEKLDITEEKIRIQKHLDYFLKNLHSKESNGKKLEFILQEMNREANTIASKANFYEIQKFMVEIKEYISKIKEQIMNIL